MAKKNSVKILNLPDIEVPGGIYYSLKHSCNVKIMSRKSSLSYNCSYERDGVVIYDTVKGKELRNKKSV